MIYRESTDSVAIESGEVLMGTVAGTDLGEEPWVGYSHREQTVKTKQREGSSE